MAGVNCHVQLLVEMGSCKLFAQAGLGITILLISVSQVARITGMSHLTSFYFLNVTSQSIPLSTFKKITIIL
jgi:hypothetical protein